MLFSCVVGAVAEATYCSANELGVKPTPGIPDIEIVIEPVAEKNGEGIMVPQDAQLNNTAPEFKRDVSNILSSACCICSAEKMI